jgi:hypothetical protein
MSNDIFSSSYNKNIVFYSKYEECINMRRKYRDTNVIIVYTGLYKTLASILDLIENKINTVVIYNIREIRMLENIDIKYILKIKLNTYDIGIHKSYIPDITNSTLKNLNGLWISFSQQWFNDNNLYNNGSYEIIKKIKFEIYEIINSFIDNNLKIIIIEQTILDKHIFSEIKSEISDHMLKHTLGSDECLII